MKINGVDPVVIEQVKEQVTQPIVRETKETRITREYKEQEYRQGQGQNKSSQVSVEHSLNQLNQVCQSMGNPISFRLVEKDSKAKVEVWDTSENRMIKESDPEDVVSVVTQVEKLLGLLLDTLI